MATPYQDSRHAFFPAWASGRSRSSFMAFFCPGTAAKKPPPEKNASATPTSSPGAVFAFPGGGSVFFIKSNMAINEMTEKDQLISAAAAAIMADGNTRGVINHETFFLDPHAQIHLIGINEKPLIKSAAIIKKLFFYDQERPLDIIGGAEKGVIGKARQFKNPVQSRHIGENPELVRKSQGRGLQRSVHVQGPAAHDAGFGVAAP